MIKRTIALIFTIVLIQGCGSGSGRAPVAGDAVKGQTPADYLISQNFAGAALVIDGNEVLLNKGFGLANRNTGQQNDPDTIFRLASITKQFTAMAVMILHERGLVSIDSPVSEYISDYPNGDIILIRQLLTHTSGLVRNFSSAPNHAVTPEELVDLFKNEPLKSTPGAQFSYSNAGYKLLGLIIEQVSGLSYAQFVEQEIFRPLGMDRSGLGPNIPNNDNSARGYYAGGSEVAELNMSLTYSGGGLVSTVNDLYKWDQSFYQNILVSEETKQQIFTPNLSNYGFGWIIEKPNGASNAGQVQSHSGALPGFRTMILRKPEQQRLIVLLSNGDDFPVSSAANKLNALLDY